MNGMQAGPEATKDSAGSRIARLVQALVHMLLWVALLFGCAGTWRWGRGWICTVVYFTTMSVTGVLVHRYNHPLIAARSKWRRKDTKGFDKAFLLVFLPLGYLQPAVAGLDAVRFQWSHMPLWTLYLGIVLFIVAMTVVTLVLVVNPYAETTVRIQRDRDQRVISSGPYRIVRHPMYVGSMLMYAGTALMLGSWWALAVGFAMDVLLIVRTGLEDATLRRELEGYEAYAAQTRYRLIPALW